MDAKSKKKKEREKRVAEKLYEQRQARMKQKKYDKMIDRDVAMNQMKLKPYVAPKTPEERAWRDAEVKRRLEHNMKILQALEEEYDREMAQREEINAKLEAEGHLSAQDKIKAIAEKAKEAAEASEIDQTLN